MEIFDKNTIRPIDAYMRQIRGKPADSNSNTDTAAESRGQVEDDGALSPTTKGIQNAQELMKRIPDVRQDKIDRLRKQLEDGTYRVDADKIADKMVKESLINDLLS